MGELGALFNPGMRHELEERRSKAMRREEEGNARDGDLRIDLESGVAVINVPGADGGSADRGERAPEQDRTALGETALGDQPAAQNRGAEQDAAADTDRVRAQDRSDPAVADSSASSAAGSSADAADADAGAARPAQPRPRGKRGLAASSR
ncbi:MAG TPA: DUF6191 domain-containing protein [Nakamurella sp.]|nr:DUF6191 domain-containing protein [Nakamurella sp.]